MMRRRTFTILHWIAELLIDCEENRTLRAVLVGMLREGDNTLGAEDSIGFCTSRVGNSQSLETRKASALGTPQADAFRLLGQGGPDEHRTATHHGR